MQLQFPKSDIPRLAKKYCECWFTSNPSTQAERELKLIDMRDTVCAQEHLTKDILREVALWVISSDNLRRHSVGIECNSENDVENITGKALQSENERVRFQVLRSLDGVGGTTATAILHLFHKDPYPFLTSKAMTAVGEQKKESFEFWEKYVMYCRTLANSNNQQMPTFVQMRTLDRALWWHSEKDDKK